MTASYRLASARFNDERILFAERNGKLYPLRDILIGGERQRLGAASDVTPLLQDWTFWRSVLPARVEAYAAEHGAKGIAPDAVAFAAPVATPNKIVCIGANYHDHIAEMKVPVNPTYPYAFIKPASNTLRGSGDAVARPKIVEMFDWEAELAAIIGVRARDVAAKDALDYVAGYANFNDLSARDWIASRPGIGVDWVRHKGFDGFAPMGPYFVAADYVPDPGNLKIKLTVNDVVKQDSNTGQMIFNTAQIIEHLSAIMTLEPGDIIATGTPAGVGTGREPPEFLKPGDVVKIEIGELGQLVTPIT